MIILAGVVAAAAGIFLFLLQDQPARDAGKARLIVGQSAPDFALPMLNGEVVRLSDFRDRVVFLNIWATWCGPCRSEMPSMEKLYQELKGEAFEMLAVSIDALGAKAVAPFVAEHKLNFPILLDVKGTLQELYSTTGVPETFIIDKNGIVVHKAIGARDWASPAIINALKDLSQKPAGQNDKEPGKENDQQ